MYEYCINKIKPYYLTKKERKNKPKVSKKVEKHSEVEGNSQNSISVMEGNSKKQSYITFEDIKRFFVDYSLPTQAKVEISLKNNPILN